MPRFATPGQNVNSLAYADERLANVPVVQAPRRPTTDDKKYPLWCEWRTNKDTASPAAEGEFWKLVKFESNGDATWVRFFADGVSGGLDDLLDQVSTNVTPDPITNEIQVDGGVVTNGSNPSSIPFETVADVGNHTLDLQIQLSTTATNAAKDINDAGIASFNSAQFSIDSATGFISLKGGTVNPCILQITVDDNTAPGTNPVLADANGDIDILATTVAAHSIPIETHSRAANAFNVEAQVTTTAANGAADTSDIGLACFNSAQFTVNATNGVVSLIGSTSDAPVLTLTGTDGGGAISPDANGNIDLTGAGGATVTGAGNTITITASATGGGLTWREETGTSANFSTDEGIFGNNAGTITLTLPAAPSVGDTFAAYQEGAGAVKVVAQGADVIRFGTSDSSAGGNIQSLNQGDCVTIVAIDSSRFRVISSIGSWTVA